MLKIGLTTREPAQRARELSGSTGVPTPFEVAHKRYVSDCYAVEQEIHKRLDRHRVGKNREFFQMTVADATRSVDSAAMGYELGGEKKKGGCAGGVGRFLAGLFLWPFYLLGWMWRRGTWGKAGAVVSVLMMFGLMAQPPDDGGLGVVPTDEYGVIATAFPVVLAEASPTWTATATMIVVRLVDVPTATPSPVATDVVATATSTATDLATATVMVVAVEAATIAPIDTATAAPTATARPTNTAASAPTSTTIPTATPRPTNTSLPAPTNTPAAVANRDANLRAGPGTEFAVVGNAQAGDALRVVGRNAAGDWYELEGGRWIAAFLVDGAPDVPVAAVIPTAPPTAMPVVVAPTATAVVVQTPAAPVATAAPSAPNPQAFQCVGGCAVAPDPSCSVKGNVNSSGERIYHVPGGQFYNRTDIKPEEGDRWVCTSAEAQAAGFRASER